MPSATLTEFTLVALGRARELEPPICSAADLAWAREALARAPRLLADPAAAAAEPEPNADQLAALEFAVAGAVREASERFAAKRVSVHPRGGLTISGGVAQPRRVWLDGGLPRAEPLAPNGRPATKAQPGGRLNFGLVFGVGTVRDGRKSMRFDPQLVDELKARLGFDRHSLDAASQRLVESLGAGRAMPKGIAALIEALSASLERETSALSNSADRACARLAAKRLFAAPVEGRPAARLWLAGASLSDASPVSALAEAALPEQAVDAAEQTPETLALCSAIAPALGVEPLGLDAAGVVKRELCANYELTPAGWKRLVALCSGRPEIAFAIGARLESSHEDDDLAIPGFAKPFPDGAAPTTRRSRLRQLCMVASLCAADGVDLAEGLDTLQGLHFSLGRPSPAANLSIYSHILDRAPLVWRQARCASPQTAPAPWLSDAWLAACARHGIEGEDALSPRGFERLENDGWEPRGDGELRMAALAREWSSRMAKGPALVRSLLGRMRALGPASKRLEREASEVADFLFEVELGFWEQAPQAMSWPWIKTLAARWHERMDQAKASEMSWTPIEPRGDADGWIDLGAGWRARELVHGGELHAEGRSMSHCVSSYSDRCGRGECRIFSLRHADGRGKSTLELECLRGKDGAEIGARAVQHRGFANSEPPLLAKVAARRLEDRLNKILAGAPLPARSPKLNSPL